jgi:hypothetical protein
MRRASLLLSALALAACASPPAPPPTPPASAAAPLDTSGARDALDAALRSLAKRNFDVSACVVGDFKVADEATVRAGEPIGERCTMLVARRADRTWLVNVRPATTATPSRAGGNQALVEVTPGAEGVKKIEYVK